MHGPDVVTIDGDKIGHVVDEKDQFLVVEHGLLKTKHALPREFTEVDESAGIVRTTLSKELVHDSPKVNGEFDTVEISRHYGLTDGYDDAPSRAFDEAGHEYPAGTEDSELEHVAVRREITETGGPLDTAPPSAGVTGGDRRRDYPKDVPGD